MRMETIPEIDHDDNNDNDFDDDDKGDDDDNDNDDDNDDDDEGHGDDDDNDNDFDDDDKGDDDDNDNDFDDDDKGDDDDNDFGDDDDDDGRIKMILVIIMMVGFQYVQEIVQGNQCDIYLANLQSLMQPRLILPKTLNILLPPSEDEISSRMPWDLCHSLNTVHQEILLCFRTRVPYGEDGEKFTYPMTLVFSQCVVNSIFAYSSKFIAVFCFSIM